MATDPPFGTPPPTTSSRELIRRVREGDGTAANRLFARYLPQLRRWGHRRMPGWARGMLDTADLVQDVAIQTLGRLKSFEPQRDGALLGYLRRSLLNRIRDQFRLAGRRPASVPIEDGPAESDKSPEEIVVEGQNRERFLAALKRLRPEDRNAIIARLELGYSYEQLALVLQKPSAEAARLSIRRALLRLAKELDDV